jgi:hypothetical protein
MSEARPVDQSGGMTPNTHALVMATALMTSISFAVAVMNVLAVVLSHVLS